MKDKDKIKIAQLLDEIPYEDFIVLANHPDNYSPDDIEYIYNDYLSDRGNVCNNCRTHIDEEDIEMVDAYGDGYFSPREYTEVCPYCRREYFEDEQTLKEWLLQD